MADGRDTERLQFLTVAEAAARLGVSRLRLRDAAARGLVPSKRDNEGRLRFDLAEVTEAPPGADGPPLAADALLDILFDEVEELQAELSTRDDEVAALSALAARQDAALDQATAALEAKAAAEARLGALLDRALSHLEADADARERLAAVTARALSHLDGAGEGLERSLAQTARFEALLARALDLAEAAGGADGAEAQALAAAADRAIGLLDGALARAEAEQEKGARAEAMLERALAAGERMERDLAARTAELDKQKQTVEAALAVSERAVALAGAGAKTPPAPRRGFLRRLFGI